jgi:hypothetical protein
MRRAQGPPRSDRDDLAPSGGPDLCGPPAASLVPIRLLREPQEGLRGAATDLDGAVARSRRSRPRGVRRAVGRQVSGDRPDVENPMGCLRALPGFPQEIRRVVYTTNAIESINYQPGGVGEASTRHTSESFWSSSSAELMDQALHARDDGARGLPAGFRTSGSGATSRQLVM